MQPKILRSLSPVQERGSCAAAVVEPQLMQLEGAFVTASAEVQAADEDEQPLCVMRPVGNLPLVGKTPQQISKVTAVKPSLLRQSVATRVDEAVHSALRRLCQGQAAVSIATLSGVAAEEAARMERSKADFSLLDRLCAELNDSSARADGAAEKHDGAPCKTSPVLQGVLVLLLRPHLSPSCFWLILP